VSTVILDALEAGQRATRAAAVEMSEGGPSAGHRACPGCSHIHQVAVAVGVMPERSCSRFPDTCAIAANWSIRCARECGLDGDPDPP